MSESTWQCMHVKNGSFPAWSMVTIRKAHEDAGVEATATVCPLCAGYLLGMLVRLRGQHPIDADVATAEASLDLTPPMGVGGRHGG